MVTKRERAWEKQDIQYLVITHDGKEFDKEHTHMSLSVMYFAIRQKPTQHCKLQLKKSRAK